MKYSKTLIALTLGAQTLLVSQMAFPFSNQTTMQASLTINAACTITKTSDLTFTTQTAGFPSPTGVSNNGAVSVNCPNGTPYTVTIPLTANDTDINNRNLLNTVDPTKKVAYALYLPDASGNITGNAWSDTPTTSYSGTGNGSNQSIKVWGTIPVASLNTAPAGVYNESLILYVNF